MFSCMSQSSEEMCWKAVIHSSVQCSMAIMSGGGVISAKTTRLSWKLFSVVSVGEACPTGWWVCPQAIVVRP